MQTNDMILHETFTVKEACELMQELYGLDDLYGEVMDEDTGEWMKVQDDMLMEDFRHFAANDIGRIQGSLSSGGCKVKTPELELV